jgi:hypothetical protein
MLKRLLIFYEKILRSRLPNEDLVSLSSIHVNFSKAKAAPPMSQERRRLDPIRPRNRVLLDNEADLLADLDFLSASIRKLRLYQMVEKLNFPAVKGMESVMELLIRKGVDRLAPDDACWELLLQEVPNGLRRVAEVLVSKGVDISAPDANGSHPLICAAYEGDIGVVELLLDNRADISAPNARGCTPLHTAVVQGHVDVVQLLLSRGADPLTYWNGWTPLLLAVHSGHTEIVELLLRNGADINATTKHDGTALHLACVHHFPIICRLLMARGADPRLIDGYGHTSIDWAMADPLTFSSLEVTTEITPNDILWKRTSLLASIRKDLSLGHEGSSYHLAKKLIFYGDEESAYIFLEQTIKKLRNGSIRQGAICSSCGSRNLIIGPRFVCKTCAEVDLCKSCMDAYVEGSNVIGCVGHEFLTVPRLIWYSLEPPAVNAAGESISQFIQRLRLRFGDQEVPQIL